jgi:murein DD-endopeptidase MepM/ murein hydrolase activator NlpD
MTGAALALAVVSLSPAVPTRAADAPRAIGAPTASAPSGGLPARASPARGAAASETRRDSRDTPGRTTASGARWSWPLDRRPALVRAFTAPVSAYGAGHRGIDLAAMAGQAVRAVDRGTVSHAGTVAGRGTVTVLHPSGLSSTYEPLVPAVRRGEAVLRGQVLGTLAVSGSHCAPSGCLHLGARRGHHYLDPIVLLVGGRVRLLPLQ